MNNKQRAQILYTLYLNGKDKSTAETLANNLIKSFGVRDDKYIELEKEEINIKYNEGIKYLNKNQFKNLLNLVIENNYSATDLRSKLNYYDVPKEFQSNIIEFFGDFQDSNKLIMVDKLNTDFRGLQVATNDSFNEIIKLGYTGDWVLSPNSITIKMIQIASMGESGNFLRGCYINAQITKLEPIDYNGKIRYRIYIQNPEIINTGNRNVKFTTNPVKYIK